MFVAVGLDLSPCDSRVSACAWCAFVTTITCDHSCIYIVLEWALWMGASLHAIGRPIWSKDLGIPNKRMASEASNCYQLLHPASHLHSSA
jgi:hypothetical protein